jgi:UDP-N-acetylglucosamine--N-acetylmuramyl-(pentapeptide) pyrophosphoryl-undecaprenol N-acetylglucosamine transferase
MKALIMPCGIGLGHASRCIALAGKLQEEGVEVLFASYGSGYEILNEHTQYPVLKLPELKFYGTAGEFDLKGTAKRSVDAPFIFLKSMYKESRIIKKFRPDVVIADSHYSVPVTCKVIGIPCFMIANELILNFSDIYPQDRTVEYLENGIGRFMKDISRYCKAVMVPDIDQSVEIPHKLKDMVFYTGPFLKKRPKDLPLKEDLKKNFGFQSSDKIVLVTVGGTNFGKELIKLVCDAVPLIDCDWIIIVTGPNIKPDLIPEFDKIIKKVFLDDMMDWMKLSDLIISLAGHTTSMEVASLGIPNLMFPIEGHSEQVKNAQNMKKQGISVIRDIKGLDASELADDINNLLDDQELKKRAEITGKKFSQYDGANNALKIIMGNGNNKGKPL